MKKRKILLIGLVVLAIVFVLRMLTINHEKRLESHQDKIAKVTKTTTEEVTEKSGLVDSVDEAKGSLETNKEVSVQKVQEVLASLEKAFGALKTVQDQSDIQLTYDNHLSITSSAMAQTLVTMFLAGYDYDATSLSVYQSYKDNVYQFVISLRKSGSESLSVTGNYVIETEQIEFVHLYGTPSGVVY